MINAAVVGLGWWGRHVIEVLDGSRRLKVVAATSRRPARHRDYVEGAGLTLLDSFEAALADTDIDAVILCTPHSQHEAQVLAAIAAGKQVFCEKPMALEKAAAARMVEAEERAGIILGIGQERRFEPSMEAISGVAADGSLGTLMHVEANFSHDLLVGLAPDDWRLAATEGPSAAMTGMGVHLTDLFISMLGPVAAVSAQTASRVLDMPGGDIITVQFRFESGATGLLAAVSATPYYGRFTLFGDQAWAEARDDGHPQHGGQTHVIRCGKDATPQNISFGPKNPVRANLEEWAAAVAGEGRYRFTDAQKIANVAVLEAVSRSIRLGGWAVV